MISLSINTKKITDAMHAIVAVIPSKPERDVLGCVKILAKNDSGTHVLELHATDLTQFFSIKISEELVVNCEGEIVVPGQLLFDFLKTVEQETITLKLVENINCLVEENNDLGEQIAQFKIETKDLEEFPVWHHDYDTLCATLNADQVKHALSKILFAVAEKGHPRLGAINCVYLTIKDNNFIFGSTDKARASLVSIDPENIESSFDNSIYLLPAKPLENIGKIFEEDIDFYVSTNTVCFCNEYSSLSLKIEDDNYPPILTIFDKTRTKNIHSIAIDPKTFLKDAKKAALAVEKGHSLKLVLSAHGFTFRTNLGRKYANIKHALNYQGSEVEFSLDPKCLAEVLKSANDDQEMLLNFSRSDQAILFNQENYDHVLMQKL